MFKKVSSTSIFLLMVTMVATLTTIASTSDSSATAVSTVTLSTTTVRASHARANTDFYEPGTSIRRRADVSSARVGLGYPGQGFNTVDIVRGSYVSECSNNKYPYWWNYGQDVATGVNGYVAHCLIAH